MMPTANRTRQLLLGDTAAQAAEMEDVSYFSEPTKSAPSCARDWESSPATTCSEGADHYRAVVGSLRQLGLDGTEEVNGKLAKIE